MADPSAPHCPTCSCGCTCGWGGTHDPDNPRCDLNRPPASTSDGERPGRTLSEPEKMYSLVRDKDGDTWLRGRTRWTCQTPVDGDRVTRVGRLPWHALVTQYGPLEVLRVGKKEKS